MLDPAPVNGPPSSSQWMTSGRSWTLRGPRGRREWVYRKAAGPWSLLFAATHLDGTAATVLMGTFARIARAPDERSEHHFEGV